MIWVRSGQYIRISKEAYHSICGFKMNHIWWISCNVIKYHVKNICSQIFLDIHSSFTHCLIYMPCLWCIFKAGIIKNALCLNCSSVVIYFRSLGCTSGFYLDGDHEILFWWQKWTCHPWKTTTWGNAKACSSISRYFRFLCF